MLLTIDAGNTRTKWAVFNQAGNIVNNGACDNNALSSTDFSALKFERVTVSNVAGEQHAALLAEKLAPYTATVCWIKATSEVCGVSNQYTLDLGADRWAALIAAWHLKHVPCVVVNAGTAVTIDALSIEQNSVNHQAVFIGGLILPGLNLMQQSLGLATAQLPKFNAVTDSAEYLTADIFAKNTADAIYSGALHAITGAIALMAHELHCQCKQLPFILLSGGNAPVIYQQLIEQNLVVQMAQQVIIVDNLVLQGLFLLDNFKLGDSNLNHSNLGNSNLDHSNLDHLNLDHLNQSDMQ